MGVILIKRNNNRIPKLSFWDVYIREPIKKWAGIENDDGGVGKIERYEKDIERNISNNTMKLNTYIREQAKLISEVIKTGKNSYDDFEFALEKVEFEILKDGNNVKKYGYNYAAYLKKLSKYNIKNDMCLTSLFENDYEGVTRLQEVIDYLKKEYEYLYSQKNRISKTVGGYNKKR